MITSLLLKPAWDDQNYGSVYILPAFYCVPFLFLFRICLGNCSLLWKHLRPSIEAFWRGCLVELVEHSTEKSSVSELHNHIKYIKNHKRERLLGQGGQESPFWSVCPSPPPMVYLRACGKMENMIQICYISKSNDTMFKYHRFKEIHMALVWGSSYVLTIGTGRKGASFCYPLTK